LPQREEQDYAALSQAATNELRGYSEKLEELEVAAVENPSVLEELSEIRKELAALQRQMPTPTEPTASIDPDDARRHVEEARSIRGRIGMVQRKTSAVAESSHSARFAEEVELAEAIVSDCGTPIDKQQLAAYKRELERLGARSDDKAIVRLTSDIAQLRWRVLLRQDWYWKNALDNLGKPGMPFLDQAAADTLIESGRTAASRGDGQGLREAVRALWKLQPRRAEDESRERALASGLRKF
jgi:hypothetical protein